MAHYLFDFSDGDRQRAARGADGVRRGIDPTASNPLVRANTAAGFRMGVVRITGVEFETTWISVAKLGRHRGTPPSHARLRSGELHHHRYAPCRRTAYDLRTGRKAFVVAYRRRDFRRRILAERRIAASRSAAYRLGDKRYPPKGDRHPGGEGRKGRDAHSGDRLPDHVGRDRSRCSLRRGSFSPASFHAVRRCAHSGPAVAGTKPPAPGCFVAIANAPIADPHPRTRNSPLDR